MTVLALRFTGAGVASLLHIIIIKVEFTLKTIYISNICNFKPTQMSTRRTFDCWWHNGNPEKTQDEEEEDRDYEETMSFLKLDVILF